MADKLTHQNIHPRQVEAEWTCQAPALRREIGSLLEKQLEKNAWISLVEKAESVQVPGRPSTLSTVFSLLPRITGKALIELKPQEADRFRTACAAWLHGRWPADHFGRLWLLLQLDTTDEEAYLKAVGTLFRNAEMSELTLLYAALPFLACPSRWQSQCAEGIRSNIGPVLEAIMYENPYPAAWLEEGAWNQMVLKAFFTDKQVERIVGLDARANAPLAAMLTGYAHERWAAGRPVHPQLWRCVGPFIHEGNFEDIRKVFYSEVPAQQMAAALACAQSDYAPAQALLEQRPALRTAIREGRLNWTTFAQQYSNETNNR